MKTASTCKVSILDDIDFSLEIMHRDKINVDYIMGLIRTIDLENEDRRKEDIKYIMKELDRADSIQLRNKVELIKEFLEKVVPSLGKQDSIDNALNQFEKDRKERDIKNFARGNKIPKDQLEDFIQEYEFSGVLDKEDLSDSLIEAEYSFMENIQKSKEVESFIREVAEEYS